MKTFSVLFVFLISSTALLWGQNTFQKKIALKNSYFFSKIQVSHDEKAAYYANSDGIHSTILKMDNQANFLWAKEFPKNYPNVLTSFVSDEGIIFSTSSLKEDSTRGSYLSKLDANGKTLWTKKLVQDSVLITRILEDDDKNIWCIAEATRPPQYFFIGTYLIKLDKNGKLLKLKYFETGLSNWGFTRFVFDKKTGLILLKLNVGVDLNDFSSVIVAFDKSFQEKYRRTIEKNLNIFDWEKQGDKIVFSTFIWRKSETASFAVGTIDIADGKLKKLKTIKDFSYLSTNENKIVIGFNKGKNLSLYDADFKPIWSKSIGKCTEDIIFYPALTNSGDCYFSEAIDSDAGVVVGKTNQNGIIENCELLDKNPILFKDTLFESRALPIFSFQDAVLSFKPVFFPSINTTVNIKDFCPKPDASFDIPDAICENALFTPQNVKFPNSLHEWKTTSDYNTSSPNLSFDKNGKQIIKHKVTIDGCSDTLNKTIVVLAAPKLPSDTQVCGQKNLVWDFKNTSAISFLLDNKIFTPPLNLSKSGTYNLKIANQACESEKNIKVVFTDLPPIDFPIDSLYCDGETYVAAINNYENVVWNKTVLNDTLLISDSKNYSYTAEYQGCLVKGLVQIPRKKCPLPEIIFVPNAFSPNDDGFNDFFQAYGNDFKIEKFEIYDRWGNHIFKSNEVVVTWIGTFNNQPAQAAVYTYYIEYQDLRRKILRTKKGDVLLMR